MITAIHQASLQQTLHWVSLTFILSVITPVSVFIITVATMLTYARITSLTPFIFALVRTILIKCKVIVAVAVTFQNLSLAELEKIGVLFLGSS